MCREELLLAQCSILFNATQIVRGRFRNLFEFSWEEIVIGVMVFPLFLSDVIDLKESIIEKIDGLVQDFANAITDLYESSSICILGIYFNNDLYMTDEMGSDFESLASTKEWATIEKKNFIVNAWGYTGYE